MASILRLLGDALYSLNPSMLPSPPEGLTFGIGGPDEVCYRAPNGDETMCKDLPPGMPGNVGTWYLDPQQHILEGIVVSLACLGVIRFFLPRLATTPSRVHHPKGLPLVAAFSCLAILYFKYFAYLKKVLYFVMPCNMQWLLTALFVLWTQKLETCHSGTATELLGWCLCRLGYTRFVRYFHVRRDGILFL
jgi:hypothetical protein